ncbi:hypothetical protein SAMN05421837_103190 [Amycolatopsis pretoriensis]|uniref:Uncharacterized protein n=1 Tax=Amycolatopsis pretoriensis TaxID=218821 RepID=A0A1H5QJU5_9PSEU|nr:hypothetical protein [Amycolatopsis pretoriensis]SEF26319.1 hypothetical protein SAMN05421837_103190 [Amycolatopsis pretoriensis]
MGIPGWWQRVVAVSEHLAAVEPLQVNEHGFGPGAEACLRIGELARGFAAEVGDAELGRVLAVLDDLLGDESEPHRRAIALTFLWPLARRPRPADLGDRVRRELDLIAGHRPAAGADPASWPELAELARDELERCGLPATVVPRGARPAPTGVVLSVSAEEPAGVFLEWNPLDAESARYQALTGTDSGYLGDYVDDVRDLFARAALDVLAAAGFKTAVRYDFRYGRSRVCRVLGPPEIPFD